MLVHQGSQNAQRRGTPTASDVFVILKAGRLAREARHERALPYRYEETVAEEAR